MITECNVTYKQNELVFKYRIYLAELFFRPSNCLMKSLSFLKFYFVMTNILIRYSLLYALKRLPAYLITPIMFKGLATWTYAYLSKIQKEDFIAGQN